MWLAIAAALAGEVSFPHAGSDARHPAFSPDGRWLAFEVAHGDAVALYVTAIGPAGDAGPADAIRLPGSGGADSSLGKAIWESDGALRFDASLAGGASRSYRYTLGEEAATELPDGTPEPVDPVADRVWFDHPAESRWDIQAALSDGTAIVIASDVGEPDHRPPALLPDGSAVAWLPTDGSAGLRLSRVDGFGTVMFLPVAGLVLGDIAVGARDGRILLAMTYGRPVPSKLRVVDITDALHVSGLPPAVAAFPPVARPAYVVTDDPDPVAVGRRYLLYVLLSALFGLIAILCGIVWAGMKLFQTGPTSG